MLADHLGSDDYAITRVLFVGLLILAVLCVLLAILSAVVIEGRRQRASAVSP